jgi:putative tricarboxylic transport membrane protein
MRDIYLGFAIIVIFGFVLLFLVPVGIFIPAGVKYQPLSPAFFPRIILLLLIFLGAVLVVQTLLRAISRKKEEAPSSIQQGRIQEDVDLDRSGVQKFFRIGAAATLLFVYYWVINYAGMWITSVFMLPMFALLYGERRLKFLIPLSLILPVLLYYFFTKVALVIFPKGSLFQ